MRFMCSEHLRISFPYSSSSYTFVYLLSCGLSLLMFPKVNQLGARERPRVLSYFNYPRPAHPQSAQLLPPPT